MPAPRSSLRIRPAEREDAGLLFGLIRELADYEELGDAVRGDAELLAATLFDRAGTEALIAEVGAEAVGYAVLSETFSTFECRPGLWIEDLFIRPGWRRRGFGRALLGHISELARERGCARLEWSALDWNEPALRFYKELGATQLAQWRILRLEGKALQRLGNEHTS